MSEEVSIETQESDSVEQSTPVPPPPGRNPEEFFSFDDQGKTRYADPMVIHRRLLKAMNGEDLDQKINTFESKAKGLAFEASEFLSGVAREVFGLNPLDEATGEGWTELASIYLIYTFMEWQSGKENSGEVRPNSSLASDSHPATD